ncbi:PD-(D/E)XK nuclease family protein [Streptomyces platensis]|uniref:PD-(D/E)XK nuclease family protein n=1 Tax=Streptomyces platensis TaxID=58346 RepID=UPI002E269A3E
MQPWDNPPGTVGVGRLARIPVRHLRDEEPGCPMNRALSVRRDVFAAERVSSKTPREEFPFALVQELLDQLESGAAQSIEEALERCCRTRSRCLPQHVTWSAAAAERYLDARRRDQGTRDGADVPRTFRAPDAWIAFRTLEEPDERGITDYERTVWGRQYVSDDATLRELVIPTKGDAKERLPLPELAAVASVLYYGTPARIPSFEHHSPALRHPAPPPRPERVRVYSAGLTEGRVRLLRTTETDAFADWTAEEILDLHEQHVVPRLGRVLDGRDRVAGAHCAGCKVLPECSVVPRAPALLVLPPPTRPRKRRTVSVSDLRAHRDCPARYHLTRVLKLPASAQENEAVRRGRAVDSWLNVRHASAGAPPCREVPLPAHLPGLTDDELAPALGMLRAHWARCPLDNPAATRFRPQHRVMAHDPQSDVMVIASCDLVYEERGGVVVRETKTSAFPPGGRSVLLEKHPQLALSVLFLAAGVLGGDSRRSRVELEILRPDGVSLEEFDPGDEATVEHARTVLASYTVPWSAETRYEAVPRPGYDCTGCEALSWCATGKARVAAAG